jgi:hypothetical protein
LVLDFIESAPAQPDLQISRPAEQLIGEVFDQSARSLIDEHTPHLLLEQGRRMEVYSGWRG